MKQFILSAFFFLAAMVTVVATITSCSSDPDSVESPTDASVYVGTWICTSSTDVDEKTNVTTTNLMKGGAISINADGTYSSTVSNFGYSGKYVLSGSKLTVTTNKGQKLSLSISYNSGIMIWEGSANGYRFHYEFSKVK